MAATVGAGILGFVVLAAVGAGGYWLYKRRKRRKLGFGGIQEDAQRAWEEFDEEISESLYAWGDRGHAPGLYDKAEPILDRSGNRVGWKIDELLDCGDLNHRIKKLTKAEDRFMAFAFSPERRSHPIMPFFSIATTLNRGFFSASFLTISGVLSFVLGM
jgi:hypothetical protein